METVTINGIEYKFRCDYVLVEKAKNVDSPALKLELTIFKNDKKMNWQDFKGTYSAEKISEYIKNTINGQRTFYLQKNG